MDAASINPAVNNNSTGQKETGGDKKKTGSYGGKESGDRVSDTIIPHLLNLYASRATAADFEIYAANASFEDPLMSAQGVKQIKSAFYSLSKVFKESEIVEYSVHENQLATGKQEILIDNKQRYVVLGKVIDMTSLIRLHVENGKIVRHEDWWDKKPIENRETAKLRVVGRLKEIVRRGSMLATHAAMGFGKDPSTRSRGPSPSQTTK